MSRRELGRGGERAAERMLRRAGLVILARNWRAAGGELDLAALEDDTLVFVEVKSRSAGFLPGRPAVSQAQRRRIARASRAFRARYGVRRLACRYDLVTLSGDPARPREMSWRKNYHRVQETR